MLTSKFSRVGLSCAIAALLVAAAPFAPASWAASSGNATASKLLKAHLPEGASLAKASLPATYDAIKAAVAERPDLAVAILDAAIAAKSSKGAKKPLDCPTLVKMVDAAAASAPDKTRELTENALAMEPECSENIDRYVTNHEGGLGQGANEGGVTGDVGEGGLGAGFGPGFPGSPGFVGSAPGGTIALPPSIILPPTPPVVTGING